MLKGTKLLLLVGFVLSVASMSALPPKALSDDGACSALFSSTTVPPNSQAGLYLQVNNNGDNPISWVQVSVPSSDMSIVGVNGTAWLANNESGTTAIFTQNTIAPGTAYDQFYFNVQGGPNKTAPEPWVVEASEDPNGGDPFACTDSGLDVSVNDGVSPIISSVAVSANETSATISWLTDEPSTSQVSYGLDDTYGTTTPQDNDLVTSHSVILDDLTPDTGYHYQISSNDISENNTLSDDNTFLTSQEPVYTPPEAQPGPAASSNNSPASAPIGLSITNASDKTPPKISLTNLPVVKDFKVPPTINGQASDSVAVQRVEYSMDNGQNWLPVSSSQGLDTTQTSFSFTPVNLPDGTYQVKARAINDGGLITETPAITLTVDRLAPFLGGYIFASGPLSLTPSSTGVVNTIAGVNQKITISAVGGPTNINLTAQKAGSTAKSTNQIYTLTESPNSLLWSGIVSIAKPGNYNLASSSVDGAGVETSQKISTINVMSDPYTYNLKTEKLIRSTVTLYYLDLDNNTWVVWDASSYGETNPQITGSNGLYKLLIPPGTYYLKATAPGYEALVSKIFKTTEPEPIITNLGLTPLGGLNLGVFHLSLPSFASQGINLAPKPDANIKSLPQNLIGQPLPNFSLSDTNGQTIQTTNLLGKPTLITIGATWAPNMSGQEVILSKLQTNQDINIVPIALQQNLGQVEASTAISGLTLNWLVDPDSTLTSLFGSPSLPTQIFVDRNGVVRQVYIGVLNQNQIENGLENL